MLFPCSAHYVPQISRVLTEGLMNVNETLTRERREREDMEQSILKVWAGTGWRVWRDWVGDSTG